jgi:hypothetical protein
LSMKSVLLSILLVLPLAITIPDIYGSNGWMLSWTLAHSPLLSESFDEQLIWSLKRKLVQFPYHSL